MSDAARGRIGRRAAFNRMRDSYLELLRKHLGDPAQPDSPAARQFGEQALGEGWALTEIAEIHHDALSVLLIRRTFAADDGASQMKAAGHFFVSSLSPYVASHSQREDDAATLRQINWRLEDQAARIAHGIFDDPLQLIAATHLVLKQTGAEIPSGEAKDISVAAGLMKQAEARLSALVQELHPCVLDHLGLRAAVEGLAVYFRELSGNEIVVEGSVVLPLPVPPARVLYRAIQEALTNITDYAQARKIHIQLQQEGGFTNCTIRDDGAGFDASSGLMAAGERGLGLLEVRDAVRAFGGSMTVHSNPDNGTELVLLMRY